MVPPSPASGYSCPLSVVRADRGMCLERDCNPDKPDCIVLQLTVSTGHRCSRVNTTLWSLVWVKVKAEASNEGLWSAKISQSRRRLLGKKSEGKGVPDDQMFIAPVSSGGGAPPSTLSLVT